MPIIVEPIDMNNYFYSKPKKGNDNRYVVTAGYKEESSEVQPLLVQILKTTTKEEINPEGTVEIDISQNSEIFKEIEEQIIEVSKSKKDEWFEGKELPDAYFDQAFLPAMKTVKRTSSLKCKIAKGCQVYNSSKEEIDFEELKKNKSLSFIIQVSGIWFSKSRFGVIWKIVQIKTNTGKAILKTNYMFEEEEEIDASDFPEGAE